MEAVAPLRDTRYTLADLLDRVLDKGVVLYADVVISLAGVPLIGLSLRAALAGIDTMAAYGMMSDEVPGEVAAAHVQGHRD